MAHTTSEPAKTALVAQVKICTDDECSFSSTRHLQINFLNVEFVRGNATAVSYVWGEFDRRRQIIGHCTCDSRDEAGLELGKEWKIDDVIDRLAEIGRDGPIWMDQLCIPQYDKNLVRKSLAKIPTIYRSFDLVVLMPGRPCACLQNMIQGLENLASIPIDPSQSDERVEEIHDLRLKNLECLNSRAMSSWITRLWPRQELRYSRRARCVWTSKTSSKCVRINAAADANDLAPYAFAQYQALIKAGYNHLDALRFIHNLFIRMESSMMMDFQRYIGTGMEQLGSPSDAHRAAHCFLSGTIVMENGFFDTFAGLPLPSLEKFTYDFSWSDAKGHGPSRRATHIWDYVTSVWVDCPGYSIPMDYKGLDLPTLLQDAVDQLHRNHFRLLISTAPLGLFLRNQNGSATWKPAYSLLSDTPPESSFDIYGTLVYNQRPLSIVTDKLGRVPMIIGTGGNLPLSAGATDFETSLNSLPEARAEEMFAVQFKTLSKAWGQRSHHEVDDLFHYHSPITQFGEIRSDEKFCFGIPEDMAFQLFIFSKLYDGCCPKPLSDLSDEYWPPYNLNTLRLLARDLVATALHMSPFVARQKGLQLMFSGQQEDLGHKLRVGLCRRGMDMGQISTCAMDAEAKEILTVRVGGDDDSPLLFEVEKVHDDGKLPMYQVFGVWVPINSIGRGDYSAQNLQSWEMRSSVNALLA